MVYDVKKWRKDSQVELRRLDCDAACIEGDNSIEEIPPMSVCYS